MAIDLDRLNESFRKARKNSQSIDWEQPIDSSQLWVPEEITHLYHTDFYSKLSQQEQLAYNQLFALLVAQQFITLEKDALSHVKKDIFEQPAFLKNMDPKLIESVNFFDSDEQEHIAMFSRLLSKVNKYRKPLQLMKESWTQNLYLRLILGVPKCFYFLDLAAYLF